MNVFDPEDSRRPLGDNPFAAEHPAYAAFEEASLLAEEDLAILKVQTLSTMGHPSEMLNGFVRFRSRRFDLLAKHAFRIVGNSGTARMYIIWLNEHARVEVESVAEWAARACSRAEAEGIPFFRQEDFTCQLTPILFRIVAYYTAEALKGIRKASEFKQEDESAEDIGSPTIQDRAAAVDTFLLACNEEHVSEVCITREHLWKAAGHRSERQFYYWQARNSKATKTTSETSGEY